MKAVSLFSGVGGFEIGLQRAGIETVLQCEIDRWALAVLRRHWPQIPKVNDVRELTADGFPDLGRTGRPQVGQAPVGRTGEGVDLVYGGFPCQPFSVAGKRAGDRDDRNLWPEFRRVVSELRPSWVLAENVVGLLSIDEGRFFGGILDDLGDLGFEGVAYAVLDSQFFGIPQRRARVFVVAGPSRRSAEQVLSICEGCTGHPPTGREAREGVAAAPGSRDAGTRVNIPDAGLVIPIQYPTQANRDKRQNGMGIGQPGAPSYTLEATYEQGVAVLGIGGGGGGGGGVNTSLVAAPLAGHHHRDDLDNDTYVVAETLRNHPRLAKALTSRNERIDTETETFVSDAVGVRRLTPLECERLMGWPDGWTEFTDDGRRIPDSHRYRLIGNGVVATVAEWIGRRLVAVANSSQSLN